MSVKRNLVVRYLSAAKYHKQVVSPKKNKQKRQRNAKHRKKDVSEGNAKNRKKDVSEDI